MPRTLLSRLFRSIRPRTTKVRSGPTLKPTDRFIASYPRSGNTWFRYLLADVILQNHGMDTSTALPVHVDQVIPDRDRGDELDTAKQFCRKRIIKTHRKWSDQFQKAIVIYRHPADCLTSYFHFHLRYENMKPLVADGIDAFCLERVSEWSQHGHSFLTAHQEGECNCSWLSYEDLQNDTLQSLMRALKFLNEPTTLKRCAIAIDNHQFAKHAKNEVAKQGTQERFFRKGQVGSGQAELASETFGRLDEVHQEFMAIVEGLRPHQDQVDP